MHMGHNFFFFFFSKIVAIILALRGDSIGDIKGCMCNVRRDIDARLNATVSPRALAKEDKRNGG